MRKYFLFTLGLVLSSPLLLAQVPPPPAPPSSPPSTPAPPATPPDQSPPDVNVSPPSDTKPNGSASVHKDRNSLGATGNPDTKSGKLRARSGTPPSDFAAMDANGDGKLTPDEASGNAGMKGGFNGADKNGDGVLTQGEYEQSFHAQRPKDAPSAPPTPKQ